MLNTPISEKREAGPDLIRCLAFLLTAVFHFFLFNGYYYAQQTGAAVFFANWARSLSLACNGLFLMLTGYFRSNKPLKASYFRSLLPILLTYFAASAISIPARHFFLGDRQALAVWVRRLLTFSGVYYGWFVKMYVGLLLLSPILNAALAHADDRTLRVFCALLTVVTALPGLLPFPVFPDYWKVCYPVTYYALGAAIRRLRPHRSPLLYMGLALLITALMGGVTLLSTDGTLSDAVSWEFGALPVTATAVLLFLSLYRVSPGKHLSSCLRFFSGGCYGAYLLSHLLDAWIYNLVPAWRAPERYPLLFLCLTVPAVLLSLFSGKALETLCGRRRKKRRHVRRVGSTASGAQPLSEG